ncbi:MAG: DUF6691 family protein [Candidatus Puniceispirillales bacterium]
MALVSALISGVVFGIGLALSGMLDPSKVAGFLDLFGVWDPSLAFVMGGGVIVNFIGYHLVLKEKKPLFATGYNLTDKKAIDRPLLIGAALFGIGWGMGGLCPGPGVASLLLDPSMAVGFVAFMIAGLSLGRVISRRL